MFNCVHHHTGNAIVTVNTDFKSRAAIPVWLSVEQEKENAIASNA